MARRQRKRDGKSPKHGAELVKEQDDTLLRSLAKDIHTALNGPMGSEWILGVHGITVEQRHLLNDLCCYTQRTELGQQAIQ